MAPAILTKTNFLLALLLVLSAVVIASYVNLNGIGSKIIIGYWAVSKDIYLVIDDNKEMKFVQVKDDKQTEIYEDKEVKVSNTNSYLLPFEKKFKYKLTRSKNTPIVLEGIASHPFNAAELKVQVCPKSGVLSVFAKDNTKLMNLLKDNALSFKFFDMNKI